MCVRRISAGVFAVAVLGMVMMAGCSGHSVRYGANSEGDGESASQGNPDETARVNSGWSGGTSSNGSGGLYDGGMVNGSRPSTGPGSQPGGEGLASGMDGSETAMGSSTTGGMGGSKFSGTDYGHNYSGVPGSGSNHGGVSGFGEGSASGINPDPEAWSNAYLRGGNSSQDFYGDPSGDPSSAGSAADRRSHSGMGMPSDGQAGSESINPKNWADNYVRENGGPSPEYVDPDMQVARVQEHDNGGNESAKVQKTHLKSGRGLDGQGGNLQDIYFEFDSWAISPQGAQNLEQGASWLKNNPGEMLTIEGHCDQRGTQDYNLVLGKKRAEAARDYLEKLGINSHRIKVVSYGKERPFCQMESEDCFQENRRSHMVIHLN